MFSPSVLPDIDRHPCLCGESSHPYVDHGRRLFARSGGYTAQLFCCTACGHKNFTPPPPPTALNEVYSTAYFNDDAERTLYAQRYAAPSFDMADDLAVPLAQHAGRAARVHEFGCGTGLTVHHLRKRGFDASGSDWSEEAIAFGRKMGNDHLIHESPTRPADIHDLDVALSNHVIEHVNDPIQFMRDMAAKLSPGGVLLLRCPNGDGAIARRMGMLFDPLFYYPHHIHYFSAYSLAACARAAGLKIISITATSRFTPGLREAVFPPVFGDDDDLLRAASTAFESEELQLVAGLPSHPAVSVDLSLTSPAPSARSLETYDSHESFHLGGPWSYDLLHETLEGCCPMEWSAEHAYWYYGRCFINDHWMAHYGTEYRPGLSFVAPSDGTYEFEIVSALRHAWLPEVRLIIDARRNETRHWIESPAPRTFIRRASLATGERFTIAVENPHPTEQKLVTLVRARKIAG